MPRRILTGAAVLVATFLLATNPVVADAARSGIPSFGTKTVALTGSAPVSAGTYSVAFRCASQLSNGGGRIYFANLSVLAVRSAS